MIVLYLIIALVVILALMALLAPKQYHVKRSIIIRKPLNEVFEFLKFIRNQDHWSPWKQKDPNMTQSSQGVDGHVGFINSWVGNKQVGSGEQEIVRIVENDRIESQLRFFKPWKSESNGYLIVKKVDEARTEVIWGFSGIHKVPANVFMLFFNMDKAVGKDFDQGLQNLKEVSENDYNEAQQDRLV